MELEPRERASVVCVSEGRLLLVRMRDETLPRDYLFLPGGGIHAAESAAQAAVRETLEETGYRVEVDAAAASDAKYEFEWQGRKVPCHTHFFRAWLLDPDAPPSSVAQDPLVLETRWEALEGLEQIIDYHPVILDHVKRHLKRSGLSG